MLAMTTRLLRNPVLALAATSTSCHGGCTLTRAPATTPISRARRASITTAAASSPAAPNPRSPEPPRPRRSQSADPLALIHN